MITATARIATERPAHYLKQLCGHFAEEGPRHSGYEIDVTFDDREGVVNFAPVVSGTLRFDARHDGALLVEATATDEEALARLKAILGEHVQRFGQRDRLTIGWDATQTASSSG